jgi:hypothetical protein
LKSEAKDNSESQLFSNITAMIVTGLASKKELKTADQRKKMLEIGLRTCVLIRGMADVVTAGVMEKTCELSALLNHVWA